MLPADESLARACYLTREERILGRLNSETHDMIKSPDFNTIMTICLDTGFAYLSGRVGEYFSPSVHEEDSFSGTRRVEMPLAKVIPIMNGLVFTVVADHPNPFLQELLLKDQMKHFAANVYDAFCESQDSKCTTK
jgi:peroxin-3